MKFRTALAIWLYALAATPAAAQVKVSDLPAASTLTGTEVVPGVQSGASKKISVAQIGAYVGGNVDVPVVTTSTNGVMIAADKLKLDGIAAGATANAGTVTSASVVTANGVSGSVATATTTPAITLSLGAITPSSVAASGTVTGSNLTGTHTGASSGTNTGDQTSVTGNAGTATALATGRTLAITGDLAWTSPAFNGTANVTAAGTLANTTVTPGTYNLATVTVDSKGRITSASNGSGGTATLADGNYGDITVSGSGTALAVNSGAITLAKQASVATGTVFYRKTAATGAPEVQTLATLKTDLGLTGTNTGDQTSVTGNAGTATALATGRTIAMTGDVAWTSPAFDGTANVTAAGTIQAGSVTNAKLANVTTGTFKGRTTAATGPPEDLTGTQATALLDTATGSLKGLLSSSDFTKLAGIATGATANSSDATLLARANHTGTQSADTLTDGTTNKAFLATERTKLTGIATGATNNPSTTVGANLLNLTNPSAITFPQINADNSVTAQSAANFRTAISVPDVQEGTWTPTIGSFSGTITTKSATGRYVRVGNMVTAIIDVTITTNGTGAGIVFASLPHTTRNVTETFTGYGKENTGGKMQVVTAAPNSATAAFSNYDGSYSGANGTRFYLTLTYLI